MRTADYRAAQAKQKPQGWSVRNEIAEALITSGAVNAKGAITATGIIRKTDLAKASVYRLLDMLPGFVPVDEEGATRRWYYEWELFQAHCDPAKGIYYPYSPDSVAAAINAAGSLEMSADRHIYLAGQIIHGKKRQEIRAEVVEMSDRDFGQLAMEIAQEYYNRTELRNARH